MPQEVDYTIAWHPVHPSKINEALFGMFYQPQEYLFYGEKRPRISFYALSLCGGL